MDEPTAEYADAVASESCSWAERCVKPDCLTQRGGDIVCREGLRKVNSMDEPTAEYVCGRCGASGCKLWREYQSFTLRLLCAPCAAEAQGKDITGINDEGLYEGKYGLTDQIGWYIPAVPADESWSSFWGYTSTPDEGIALWQSLPTLPASNGRRNDA